MSVRAIEAEVSIKSGVQAECTIGRGVVVEVHEQPITESLSVTANGTYTPPSGVDGFDRVVVSVPPTIPEIEALTVTEDGVYTSSGDGYNPVTVNTGVASLRQEIASAETASGCDPLVDGLTALTIYANEVTGAEDATLSDAVETLVNGYGFLGRKVKTGVLKLNSKFSSKVSILYTNDRGIGFIPSYFAIWVSNRTGLSRYSVLYAFYSSTPQYKATINLSTSSGSIGATASGSSKETIDSNMLYTSGVFIYFEGSANYALEATEYNWIAIE